MEIPPKHKEKIVDYIFYMIDGSYKVILEDEIDCVSESVFNEEYSLDDINDFVKKCKEIVLKNI